ncbi:MAG: ParB/RepB/Spo0J family partition protein [Acidobacteria bacterium Pan2503]|uniref:ParB/RepB/Spo0J family partition protein n=1 Tax=Candidatus Acidiferrum panamense TaxID=2741543 RepID=A0A7V8NNW6_9BACT|nr:ParB/RepB/Spo0J family partition protein [Candidatus Acidoferrum panamensis]
MPETRMIPRAQLLEPPLPIRMGIDEQALGDLADSIKRHGLLHPLIVVPAHVTSANGELAPSVAGAPPAEVLQLRWEIVDGHRRYLASLIAGLDELECKVYDTLDDAKFGVMLDANMMRQDLSPAEEGVQFLELAESRGWSMPQLMRYFGRSEAYINERVTLVKNFPDVFRVVAERGINWTQAKAVMRCPDKNWRAYMLDQAVTHGASSRTIVNLVDQWKTLQLAKDSQPAVHTTEHAVIIQQAERPKCTWCLRNDDQANFISLPVHSYHVRDLQDFLKRTGITPEDSGETHGPK